MIKKAILVLAVLFLLFLSSCASLDPQIRKCVDACVKSAGLDSQMVKDACLQGCSDVKYMGGEALVESVTKDYETEYDREACLKQDLETGKYDDAIKQCAEWKVDLIKVQNQKERDLYARETNIQEVNLEKEIEACRTQMKGLICNQGQTDSLGIQYKQEADQIKEQLRKFNEECYPVVFEYKTLVYTKRNELGQHNIESEARSDCATHILQDNFPQNIQPIIDDLPNWR